MNAHATIGHNNPPDPIDVVTAEYDGVITEAQNWTDGAPVEDEAGMKAVDAVIKEFKTYRTALVKAGKERTDPLHKAWKAEVSAVKVYTDDADRIMSALVATVAPFKEKLAREQQEAKRRAWEETERLRREAAEKEAAANAADLEAQREIAAAKQAAIDAEKATKSLAKNDVKGMRKVTRHEVTDMRELVRWIAVNDKPAMAEFATEYARRNHKTTKMDGVHVWTEKEAF